MITINDIRNKLQEAIHNSGMTQTELAKKLNIYQSAVQQYLSGRAMPALDTLANLCIILDLDANDILCINDCQKTNKTYISNSFNNSNNSGNFKF